MQRHDDQADADDREHDAEDGEHAHRGTLPRTRGTRGVRGYTRYAVTTPVPAATAADLVIRVRGLRKSYGDLEAVKGIDLEVRGARSSRCWVPTARARPRRSRSSRAIGRGPTATVSVLGHDPGHRDRRLQERVGICLQTTGIERYLSVVEVHPALPRLLPDARDPSTSCSTWWG